MDYEFKLLMNVSQGHTLKGLVACSCNLASHESEAGGLLSGSQSVLYHQVYIVRPCHKNKTGPINQTLKVKLMSRLCKQGGGSPKELLRLSLGCTRATFGIFGIQLVKQKMQSFKKKHSRVVVSWGLV